MEKTWRGRVRYYASNGALVAESDQFGFGVPAGPEEASRARAMLRKAWQEARMAMTPSKPDALEDGLAIRVEYEVEPT